MTKRSCYSSVSQGVEVGTANNNNNDDDNNDNIESLLLVCKLL